MKTTRLLLSGLAVALSVTLATTRGAQPTPVEIPREEVRLHFKVLRRLNPKVGDLFRKLVAKYKDKPTYTAEEVQAIAAPKAKTEPLIYDPKPKLRDPAVPQGAFSAADAQLHLRVLAERSGTKEDLVRALEKKYGRQPWYLGQEVRDVQENGSKPQPVPLPPPPAPLKSGWEPIVDGLAHFKIRQNWSDVTAAEDPSQADENKKVVGDLVGASFSYTHDGKANSDTWAAVGSLIFPMEWTNPNKRDIFPERFVLAPSVSLNRVSTNGDPKKESDELYYRIGLFGKWVGPSGWLDIVELRGALIYGTDTGNRAQLPASEADFEPRISWVGVCDTMRDYAKIGFRNVLVHKKPELEDQTDDSLWDYQLRVYLHTEGGDLQRAGTNWNVVEGSFFRLGPTAQLRMNAPRLMFGHAVSLTGLYGYTPAVNGPKGHDSLLKLDLNISIVEDPELNRKISLHANYTKGGLDLTKQDVDQFTVGLGVLF
jgi:hypothetical protein